jgi:hypothetical protein
MNQTNTIGSEEYIGWVCESPWGPDSKHVDACSCAGAGCGRCNAGSRFSSVFDPSNLVALPEDRL